MVRNSLDYMGWNKRDLVATDLKRVYTASTIDEAEQYMAEFEANFYECNPVGANNMDERQ